MVEPKSSVVPFAARAQLRQPAQEQAGTSAPLNVLVIDDTPEDRMVVRVALEAGGFVLQEAANAERGLHLAKASLPDCILLDYSLPDMEGLDILQALRGEDGRLPCAVVMLTGHARISVATAALKAGALDYLPKDRFDPDGLRRSIANAVRQFRLLEAERASERRNAQLAAIVAASKDAIVLVQLDDIVVSWNPAAEALFGYSEDEAVGRTIEQLIVPEHAAGQRQRLYEEVKSGRAVSVEAERRRKDGSLVPVEIDASPMQDGKARVIGLSLIYRDITDRKRIETALRESEARLTFAQRAATAGVWDVDLTTGHVSWSEPYYALYGLARDVIPSHESWIESIHPDDRARVDHEFRQSLAPGGEHRVEFRIVRDGEVRWLRSQGEFTRDAHGRAVRVTGITFDIAAAKQAEIDLVRAAERADIAQQAANAALYEFDLKSGHVHRSTSITDLLGYAPEEIEATADGWRSLIHDEDRDAVWKRFKEIRRSGESLSEEYRLRHRDGHYVWVSDRARFYRDPDGSVARLAGMVVDITARKQTEEALRESEQRLQLALTASHTGVWEWNIEADTVVWSPQCYAIFGVAEFAGTSDAFTRTVHPDDAERVWSAVNTALEQHSIYQAEFRIVRPDQEVRWVSNLGQAFYDRDGKPKRLLGTILDITERKRDEERAADLMREVNHRAKNMLSLIQAVARQTVANTGEDFVKRFGERLQALAANQDLLVRNEWRGIALSSLVQAQLAHFADLIGTRITIEGPPLQLTAPATQAIGMALHELATNAQKYGALSDETGRVQISWRLEGGELNLSWSERDGPAVRPPERWGFGSRLIKEMSAASVGGHVDLDYASGGILWRLTCPVANVAEATGGGRTGDVMQVS